MDDKTKSIVAHITLIGWVIAIVMNSSDKGENTSFYLRQTLGIWLLGIAGSLLGMLTIGLIGTLTFVVTIVFWILSLVGALSGEQKPIPVFGEMFQEWFNGLS